MLLQKFFCFHVVKNTYLTWSIFHRFTAFGSTARGGKIWGGGPQSKSSHLRPLHPDRIRYSILCQITLKSMKYWEFRRSPNYVGAPLNCLTTSSSVQFKSHLLFNPYIKWYQTINVWKRFSKTPIIHSYREDIYCGTQYLIC